MSRIYLIEFELDGQTSSATVEAESDDQARVKFAWDHPRASVKSCVLWDEAFWGKEGK